MKLVLIEWRDAHSGASTRWRSLDELRELGNKLTVRSVGWLICERNGHKVIVPHISGGVDDGVVPFGCGEMVIPNAAIKKMRVLLKA